MKPVGGVLADAIDKVLTLCYVLIDLPSVRPIHRYPAALKLQSNYVCVHLFSKCPSNEENANTESCFH